MNTRFARQHIQFFMERLIRSTPDKDWDWNGLCTRETTSFEFLQEHFTDKDFINFCYDRSDVDINEILLSNEYYGIIDFTSLCTSKRLKPEHIAAHRSRPWNWFYICGCIGNVEECIEKYPNFPWDWHSVSFNKSLTMKFIEQNLDKCISWEGISYNETLTIDFILKYSGALLEHIDNVSRYANISPEDISEHPEIPWNYDLYIHNPNCTMIFVILNFDKFNKNADISSFHGLTIDFVNKYQHEVTFDWYRISANPAFGPNDVLKNPHLNWNVTGLCANPRITMDFIKSHYSDQSSSLNYSYISRNPSIKIHEIEEIPDFPWKYSYISRNYFIGQTNEFRELITDKFTFATEIFKELSEKVFHPKKLKQTLYKFKYNFDV